MRDSATIDEVVEHQGITFRQRILRNQTFWVTIAVILICLLMTLVSDSFATADNLFNVTRNFAFIGIIAVGMTAVVITAGIDLSVGSVMGFSGIVAGLVLTAGYSIWVGIAAGLLTALACGAVNGYLIAYLGLSPFVVTLGMLSIARSLALVVSNNKMVYEFGPDEELFIEMGGGTLLGVANPVWVLLVVAIVFGICLKFTAWGQHVYAIGSNEHAARLTGVPVNKVKFSVYLLSSLTAGISALMIVGWLGAVTNALGMTYELRVIAAAVIGGADLMGGVGGAYGAVIGAALIEIIRNGLLMAGVDPYWQGAFVGIFIVLAVMLEKVRGRRAEE